MKYNIKLIQSGDILELYEYEYTILTGKDRKARNNSRVIPREEPEDLEESRKHENDSEERSAARARKMVRRLINSNVERYYDEEGRKIMPKFLTLTFADNITDLEYANAEFMKFTKRFNYHVTGQKKAVLKYVAVVEFQKRGAVHYHVIYFNLPYTPNDEIREIWGHGFVKINAIEHVTNVGAYVCKYMGKTFEDEKARHDKHRKRYFASRGLYKPVERAITDEKELSELVARLAQFKVFEAEFENDYVGKIKYTQFNANRKNL